MPLCGARGSLFLRWWEPLHTYPLRLFAYAEAGLFCLFLLSLPLFYNRQLQREGRWGQRLEVLCAVLWLLCSLPIGALPGPALAARVGVQLVLTGVVFVSVIGFLLRKSLQRDIQARILALPLLLWCGTILLDQGLLVAQMAGSAAAGSVLAHLRVTLPVPLRFEDIAAILFMLALPLLPIYRFTHTLDEGQRVTTELETARSVQRALVPEEIPRVPGLTIATAYHPAQEVGGDFFQVLALPSGATLIVVGDVSGKGLPAALAVSLVIGTLRTVADYTESPGEVLSSLNRRAKAQANSFTTCLVLRIAADCRSVMYANAGHLAPYLNGTELVSEPSLPLGLSAEETFVECSCRLREGDHLTLLTDGVPEATRDGQLFGFDRTHELSREGAAAIASAARRFGQADDITVLTVEVGQVGQIPDAAKVFAAPA